MLCIRRMPVAASGRLVALLVLLAGGMLPLNDQAPPPAAPGIDAHWWAAVQSSLSAAEYAFDFSPEAGLAAPNRAQNLRLAFTADGFSVAPRRQGADDWRWRWRSEAWGRPGALVALPPVAPRAELRRVQYDRVGMTEWYENGETGLEQGFTLSRRPAGAGPLQIVGRVDSDLRLEAGPAGDALSCRDERGALRLRYDALAAWDAEGRALPCRLELAAATLSLVVDDAGAQYPVVIDPMLTTPDWEVHGAIANAEMGYRVATAGDINGDGYSDVIAGSPDYTTNGVTHYGRAWLFLGGAGGLDTAPDWEVTTTQDACRFGYSVSTAGDVNGDGYDDVLVGAPDYELDSQENGCAFLYLGSASGLDTSADWREDGSDVYVSFGYSVAAAGDVNGDGYDDIIIGDPFFGTTGRATIYLGGAAGPDHTLDWFVNQSGRTGHCVAGAGDVNGDGYADVIVGSPWRSGGLGSEGAFYVYHGGAGGPDTTADRTVIGDEIAQYLGYSVARAGDVNGDGYGDVLVGGVALDGFYATTSKVQLYTGGASGVGATPVWEKEQTDDAQPLGYDLATAGDVNGDGLADVLVGCRQSDLGGADAGTAWLYLGSLQGLATTAAWTVDGEAAGDFLGPVATAGDVDGDGFSDILLGATGSDVGHTSAGALYCYAGAGDLPKTTSGWYAQGDQVNGSFGYRLASGGDVNGDGYDDLWVGAPWYDNGQADEGAVFLFLGSQLGLAYVPAWWAEGDQEEAHFGFGLDSAGDVNGDGLADVIVGASWYDAGAFASGAAFLWYGTAGGAPTGNPTNADWSVMGTQANAMFGAGVCGIGDVNGDGFGDIAAGAPYYDNGTTDEGGVWAYYGGPAGPSTAHDWFHDTGSTNSGYGLRLSTAGDMNGDGYSDLLVAAPLYNHPDADEGLISVYLGGEDGLQTGAPWWYAQSDEAGAQLGLSIACAGDVDGDGYSDIIAGAPYKSSTAEGGGAAYVWLGAATAPPTGTPANAELNLSLNQDYAHLGSAVSSAGDVDGDGYSDILVGAPHYSGAGLVNAGLAFIYRGSPDGIVHGAAPWLIEGIQEDSWFGNATCSGDFNGDGFSDVVVGAENYSLGQDMEGVAFLFYGNGGRGLSRTPRQWKTDGLTRLAPLGRSDALDAVAISARGRTPGGRGQVRLVAEVKPLGTAFNGSGSVSGTWTDTGAPAGGGAGSAVDLAPRLVGGLSADTAQHWRLRLETGDPFFPRTPWLSLSANAVTMTDFRTRGAGTAAGESPAARALALDGYPNPFNPATTLSYRLPADGAVQLSIHDAAGRCLRELVATTQAAGPHTAVWNGCDGEGRPLASGVYFARLQVRGAAAGCKLVLLK